MEFMSDLIKYIPIKVLVCRCEIYIYGNKIVAGLLTRLTLIGEETFPFLEEHLRKAIGFQERFKVFIRELNFEPNQHNSSIQY